MTAPLDIVNDIRSMDAAGRSRSEIARMLHVSQNTVAKYADMEDTSPAAPTPQRRGRPALEGNEEWVAGVLEADLFDLRCLASRNATVLLFVSLLFSVAILACVDIRGDAVGDSLFTFTLLAILAIGYVAFAALFVCFKIFIDKLVARWRHNALTEIERAWTQDGERAALSL